MRILPTVIALLFSTGLAAGDPPAADPADVATPDAIIRASYEAISRPPGERSDWDRYRSLFHPRAVLFPNTELLGGEFRPMSVDEFIEWVEAWYAANVPIGSARDHGFEEEEVAVDLDVYGDVAQAFSTYEKRLWDEAEAFGRGIQSFQLVRNGDRWWITGIAWDEETGAGPVPEAYLSADGDPIVVAHRYALDSEVLDETRRISVRVPPGYDASTEPLPVLYMTDAEWNFLHAVGLVDYLARWARVPEMIVVAVDNTQRGRDLTPMADPNFIGTGGAERFLEFFESELIPWVEARYSTSDHRLFWGHSFGGVFAFYALTERPDLFDIHLSAGASLWLSNDWMLSRMRDLSARVPGLETFLYFTAGEGDGGPTLPSNRRMAEWLEGNAPDGLEWHYRTTPQENHFTNAAITLQHGLQAAYPVWGMDEALYDSAMEAGPEGVASWLEARQTELGDRFVMPEFEIGVVGFRLLQAGRHDAALAVFDLVAERFPESGFALDGKGLVYESMGRLDLAAEWFARALEVGEENDEQDFMINRYRAHLERVRGN